MPLDSLPLTGQLRRRADRFLLLVLTAFWGITLIQGWLAGELASAVTGGAILLAMPALLVWHEPGALVTRLATGAAAMLLSALSIFLSGGAIEAHFAIFVLLGLLLVYFDWRVLLFAAAVIAVHHLGFNYAAQAGLPRLQLFPSGPDLARVLVHAACVVAETAALIVIAIQVERQLNYPLGILMDLQGPKLRVGRFAEGAVQLQKGQTTAAKGSQQGYQLKSKGKNVHTTPLSHQWAARRTAGSDFHLCINKPGNLGCSAINARHCRAAKIQNLGHQSGHEVWSAIRACN